MGGLETLDHLFPERKGMIAVAWISISCGACGEHFSERCELHLVVARMPENMFNNSFGLVIDEKVFVLAHIVRVKRPFGRSQAHKQASASVVGHIPLARLARKFLPITNLLI
jgi:hypothetical protein